MKKSVSVTIAAAAKVPKVPNFIQLSDERWVPLCDLHPDDLENIGKEWTQALRARAAEQEKESPKFRELAKKEGSIF